MHSLSLFALGGDLAFPIHQHRSAPDHGSQVHGSVLHADALQEKRFGIIISFFLFPCSHPKHVRETHLVRPATPDHIVLRVLVCQDLFAVFLGDPSLGHKLVGLGVRGSVVRRIPERGDDHGPGGHGVVVGELEGLAGLVRDHDDGRHEPQALLDTSPSVDHVIDHVQRSGRLDVPPSDPILFLPDLFQYLGVLGHVLKEVDDGRGHGVLRGKEKGEDDHGDLVIGVFPAQHPTLFFLAGSLTGLDHLPDPGVEQTRGFVALGHVSFRGGRGGGEVLHGDLSSLDGIVDVGARERQGEIDQLESDGDQPVLVGNLLSGGFVHVIPRKHPERGLHVQIPHGHHVSLGRGRGVRHPLFKVSPVNGLLDREVDRQGLFGEQDVERFTIVSVDLAVQKDPT